MTKIYKKGTIVMIDNGTLLPLSPEMPLMKVEGDYITIYDTTDNSIAVSALYNDISDESDNTFSNVEECITYLKDFIYE